VLRCAVSPAAASYLVTVNAVSGTTAENDALIADGSYGMWSLDAEQVSICSHARRRVQQLLVQSDTVFVYVYCT
jgi:hypothetical protein